MATSKRKQRSGYAKMVAAGKRAIMLQVTPYERDRIKAAANLERRSMANFIVVHALRAALALADADEDTARPGR